MLNSGCSDKDGTQDLNLYSTFAGKLTTKIVAVDGYIKDATLTDANGQKATYSGDGVYEFSSTVTHPITLDGGYLEGSELQFDLSMKANSGGVISPITTLIADHPDLAQKLIDSIDGVDNLEDLSSDYIDSNNSDLAKISQVVYVMIKDDDLKDSFVSSLSSSEPKSIEEVFSVATNTVNSSNSNEKTELNSFLTTVKSYDGDTSDMENHLSQVKDTIVTVDNTPPTITIDNTISVEENITSVSTVSSTDSHTVSYSISGIDSDKFDIDSTTGDISFKNPPDYENHQDNGADGTYNITIIATDSVGNSSSKDIDVVVLDSTSSPVKPYIASSIFPIAEDIGSNSTVGTLIINDGDSPITGVTLSGTDNNKFDISNSGVITVADGVSFDYESKNSYPLSVVATNDIGDSDSVSITVNISNVNEAPIISSTSFTIEENTTAIGTISATDEDEDDLTYSISGGDSDSFTINSSSGEISFNTAPDYETKNSYNFSLSASDGSLSDTQTIAINVTNIVEPFVTTWRTTTDEEEVTIPILSGLAYDYTVDWGDENVLN